MNAQHDVDQSDCGGERNVGWGKREKEKEEEEEEEEEEEKRKKEER
jgi:hypothetical protein